MDREYGSGIWIRGMDRLCVRGMDQDLTFQLQPYIQIYNQVNIPRVSCLIDSPCFVGVK